MEVILAKDAQKEFSRLPKPDQQKIKKKLYQLQISPELGKKLLGEFMGIRSLRAWPYRIFYEVNRSAKRIEVLKISHRQGAYK